MLCTYRLVKKKKKKEITYRGYSQWSDVVGANPRDIVGPDANDGLPGAAACWRTPPSLLEMARLWQDGQRHRQQSPNLESWQHLSCRARMCELLPRAPNRGGRQRAFTPCTMKCCTGSLTSANQAAAPSTLIMYEVRAPVGWLAVKQQEKNIKASLHEAMMNLNASCALKSMQILLFFFLKKIGGTEYTAFL